MNNNQKRLIRESFMQGFTKGWSSTATGETIEHAFEDCWSYYEQTVFNKPEWKPYIEKAKSSYKFCFENGFAAGVHQGSVITPEKAFDDWFEVQGFR